MKQCFENYCLFRYQKALFASLLKKIEGMAKQAFQNQKHGWG